MRDGGIVRHIIFVFYNPSPASRELPLHKGALFLFCTLLLIR